MRILLSFSLIAISALLCCGCGSDELLLMPRPNLYELSIDPDPFAATPEVYRKNPVPYFYITDRQPVYDDCGKTAGYSSQRNNRMIFGEAEVNIGGNISWEELKRVSSQKKRDIRLPVKLVGLNELVKGPQMPKRIFKDRMSKDTGDEKAYETLEKEVRNKFADEMRRRLAQVERKEVFLFIGGYNSTFSQGITDMLQVWHYMGRQGVPISFCWPASTEGFKMFRYLVDTDSGDCSITHLKYLLHGLSQIPEIEKVHFISHSLGCYFASQTLLEIASANTTHGLAPGKGLNLGNIIMIAPDIDNFYMLQRVLNEEVPDMGERFVLYVSEHDRGIGVSKWMRRGMNRIGMINLNELSKEDLEIASLYPKSEIIVANAKPQSTSNHSYYLESPSASSDLILLLRYNLQPGKENGRPLKKIGPHMWELEEGYPYEGYRLPTSRK